MAEEKRDHLGLCNEAKMPFQDFMKGYCSRCFQPECTRSLHGKSRFDHRIQNWEKLLFTEIPRLDPSDNRYQGISAKRFLEIAPTKPNTPSAWLDPREIEPVREISIPAPVAAPPPPPPASVAPPPPSPAPPQELPVEPPPPQVRQPAPQGEPVLRNTAAKPRQMIGGAEQKAPPPVLDPWQPKQPLKPDDVLIQPGGRIKLR